MPEIRIRIDGELCIGAAKCVDIAPGTFALNDDQIAFVVGTGAETEEEIRFAAERCPTGAIYLDE
jgi:ferredoxin